MTSKNYVLGRGKIYFDQFRPGTEQTVGERYLGNTPSFSMSIETEQQEHFSSEEGLRVKDESVTTQVDYTGTLTTDNISPENLALFFFGDSKTLTQTAQTGQEHTRAVSPGLSYQIGATDSNPSGVRKVTDVSVAQSGSELEEGTDFEADRELGRVTILEGGAIAEETEVTITYSTEAATRTQVISGRTVLQGALRFISFNGVGEQKDFYLPKVNIRSNGEYQLKGDEWQQISFNLEVLRKGNLAEVYADGRAYLGG